LKKLIEFFGKITVGVLYLLVALILFDTLNRYLFSSGSIALQELEWHLFDLIILLSISYTLLHNRNVRVDILYERFNSSWKQRIDKLSHLLFIIPFSVAMAIYSIDFTALSFNQMEGSSSAGGLPYRFLVKSLITVGFLSVALLSISLLFENKGEKQH
jgi:TRAP-type mannitol/chloroaromatic compound transport system permease small subunit